MCEQSGSKRAERPKSLPAAHNARRAHSGKPRSQLACSGAPSSLAWRSLLVTTRLSIPLPTHHSDRKSPSLPRSSADLLRRLSKLVIHSPLANDVHVHVKCLPPCTLRVPLTLIPTSHSPPTSPFRYFMWLTFCSTLSLQGHPDLIVAYMDNATEGDEILSIQYFMDQFKDAIADGDMDEMTDIARVTTWWTLANSSSFLLVTAVIILDAVTMASFVHTVFTSLVVIVGSLAIFGLSTGPSSVFVFVNLVVHCWTVRYTESRMRKEFVKAQKEVERIEMEEEKIRRKNEALEEKLKLTVEQLNIIEEEQEAVVGDRMAELKAWKMDVDTEIQFDKKVAAGAFGIVYLGKLRATGRDVAVKQLLSDQVRHTHCHTQPHALPHTQPHAQPHTVQCEGIAKNALHPPPFTLRSPLSTRHSSLSALLNLIVRAC